MRILGALATGLSVLLLPASAAAQDFPNKPIRLIVPFPPGGPNDIIARVIGQRMSELTRQPVLIDNRGGQAGVLGTDAVATVIPSSVVSPSYGSIVKATMSAEPSAVRFAPTNAEEIWPHTRMDVVREVNKRIGSSAPNIGTFDIESVKGAYDILKNHPEFAYKPHRKSSPQYSDAFIDWLIDQYTKNRNFFSKARENFKKQSK